MNTFTSPVLPNNFFDEIDELNSKRPFTQVEPFDDNHLGGAFKRAGLFTSQENQPSSMTKKEFFEDELIRASNFIHSVEKEPIFQEINFIKENPNKKREELKNFNFREKNLWKKKVFFILMNVFRFIKAMKMKIISLRMWQTKLEQLTLVGDSVFFPKKKGILQQHFQPSPKIMITNVREKVSKFYKYKFLYG